MQLLLLPSFGGIAAFANVALSPVVAF